MSLAIWFNFLCAQHVSDINISIIRSLRLFCWITTLGVLFLVRCVLEFRCGWVGVVSVLQAYQELATSLLNYHIGRIVLGSTCDGVSVWLGWCGIRVAGFSLQHGYHTDITHRTKNNTTNVVIQQNSRKFLMMDILMSEICWAHKKWNKIESDIKLVSYSSTITMMHGPIYIRNTFHF